MSSVAVITLQPADVERYAALRREMLHDSPWAFASSPAEDRGCDVEQMRLALAGVEYAVLAVEDDNAGARLVAAAGVLRETKLKRRHIAMIWGVYTTPTARGHGFGRAVVEAAIDTVRRWNGVTSIALCVTESVPNKKSPARLLYESLGFQAWGTEPDAMRVDGVSYADTHMTLHL